MISTMLLSGINKIENPVFDFTPLGTPNITFTVPRNYKLNHLISPEESFMAGFSVATRLYLISRDNHLQSSIDITQMETIKGRKILEGVLAMFKNNFREELVNYIADRFRELDEVKNVNYQLDDLNTITFTVIVDMPIYDDLLMDKLLDIELDWAQKTAGWGLDISCIYLPSSQTEPDLLLDAVTVENLL